MLIDIEGLAKKYRFEPKGVLHIGANVGEERNTYHNLKVDRVVWIEAMPNIYERLKQNIARYPNQEALNYCIGDVEGKHIPFNVANNGSQSSSILELGTHSQVHPEVKYIDKVMMKMRRIDKLDHDWSGLDFLNIDLQGAEMMALKGMGDVLDQFKYAYLEVNWRELYKGCALFDEVVLFMKSKGFVYKEAQKSGGHGWGDAFFMRPL